MHGRFDTAGLRVLGPQYGVAHHVNPQAPGGLVVAAFSSSSQCMHATVESDPLCCSQPSTLKDGRSGIGTELQKSEKGQEGNLKLRHVAQHDCTQSCHQNEEFAERTGLFF